MTEKTIHYFWAAVDAEVRRVKCYHAGHRGLWRAPELLTPGTLTPQLLKEGVTLFETEEQALRRAIEQGNVKREVLGERILTAANRLLSIVNARKEEPNA